MEFQKHFGLCNKCQHFKPGISGALIASSLTAIQIHLKPLQSFLSSPNKQHFIPNFINRDKCIYHKFGFLRRWLRNLSSEIIPLVSPCPRLGTKKKNSTKIRVAETSRYKKCMLTYIHIIK